MRRSFLNAINIALITCVFVWLASFPICAQTETRLRVAVLDFGDSATGAHAAEKVRDALSADTLAMKSGVMIIDRNLAITAAHGNGFKGSLNLTTQEARDLGAAIGCDFFIIGDADTVKRSPSTGVEYFESYAAIFIVSARTGRLVSWDRPAERRDTSADAEQALYKAVFDATANRYRDSLLRAAENEAAERAAAVETPPATIEVMSDEDDGKGDTRAPRPYRRVKPPYPAAAAEAEVEAVVDVLVDVDARGEISRMEVARWAGYGLDESVTNTVKQMHFFPAMREGQRISMRVLLRYNFRRTMPNQSTSNPGNERPKIIIKPRP